MLTCPTDASCVLVETSDLDATPPPRVVADVADQLRAVVAWGREYLCEPHPDLGRRGPVCPYAQASLDRGHFYLAVVRGATIVPAELDSLLVTYRDWFRHLQPRAGLAAQFKAILLVFPDLPTHAVTSIVDATQERLKPHYVADGLMIGEFHSGPPPKAGLWNPEFRPLRSPVPLLAIRHMVPSDFPFLADDRDLVAAYLTRFPDAIPPGLRDRVTATARAWGLPPPGPAPAPQPQGVS